MTSARALWLVAGLSVAAQPMPATAAGTPVQTRLVAVEVSTVGHFAKGYSWHLRVRGSGQAELTIDTDPTPIRRRFTVPATKLAELVDVAERQQFASLARDYGQDVPDGSTTVISIDLGRGPTVVTIRYLMNWVYSDPRRLQEPARALRVLQVVRGWFNDAEAVDLRRYDDMVLDAAGGRTRG